MSIFKHHYYGREQYYPNDWFSNCCGASYIDKPNEKTKTSGYNKGIKVINGLVGKPYSRSKGEVAHVKTRNGDFTVSVRHEW